MYKNLSNSYNIIQGMYNKSHGTNQTMDEGFYDQG
jgi:hypothetical protein